MTWGVVLPPNKGASDVVLESIEPAEPISGLTVLGTGVNDPAVFPVGSAAGYPQPGLVLQDVKGAVLAPDDAAQPRLQVPAVYGLRLDAAPGTCRPAHPLHEWWAQVRDGVQRRRRRRAA